MWSTERMLMSAAIRSGLTRSACGRANVQCIGSAAFYSSALKSSVQMSGVQCQASSPAAARVQCANVGMGCNGRQWNLRGMRPTAVLVSIPAAHEGALAASRRFFSVSRSLLRKSKESQIQRVENPDEESGEGEGEEDNSGRGYLPFRAPFHTFNVIMLLFVGNVLCYLLMRFGNDDTRDFLVEHFTLSRKNWSRIYPLFTNAFFQENLLQLLIDCWLLSSVGNTLLSFLGNARLSWLALLCVLGGGVAHLAKQQYFLFNGEDELIARGCVYGPNTFIMGLIALEGLIFRHLTFVQQPPIPYLVLTAFVMALDVWRISTMQPEEHGAATGGALMALVFWALPIRFFGMDKLTAMV